MHIKILLDYTWSQLKLQKERQSIAIDLHALTVMNMLTVVFLSSWFLASCAADSSPLHSGMHLHAKITQAVLQASSERVKRQSAAENFTECTKISQEYQCTSGYTQGRIREALMCRNKSTAGLMAQACAKNEQGEYCGAVAVNNPTRLSNVIIFCHNSTSCSDECRNALDSLKNAFGCCLNSVYNTTAIPAYGIIRQYLSFSLWQQCNVVPPSACTNGLIVPQVPPNAQTCTLEQYSRRITEYDCSSSNGQPLIDRILRNNSCIAFARTLVDACAINSDGLYCNEVLSNDIISGGAGSSYTSLLASCYSVTTCTPSCRMSIEDAKSTYGCCLGLTNRTLNAAGLGSPSLSYAVWNSCGVDPPEAQCMSTLMDSTLTGYAACVKGLGWVIGAIAVLAMTFN